MLSYCLVSLVMLCTASAVLASRPSVSISSGPVIGTTTKASTATAVANEYLGIPFADTPPERFSPPTDPKKWFKPLDATKFKPACIQQFNYPELNRNRTIALFNSPGGPPPEENEDCLYLNVFTPSKATPSGGRAVLFWIYGGNLEFGTGGLPAYNGASIAANQDLVVVTINYRTNVFGFSSSPEIPFGQQNSGFLDQRKALDWVQKNIKSFGGDPEKVTIFGESAGAFSVKQLIATPPKPLPFRAAILESTGATIANGSESYATLLALTNCETAASGLACLRALPAATLKNVLEENSLVFSPASDRVTSVRDIREPIQAGTAAKVPTLQGTNRDEGTALAYSSGLSPDTPEAVVPIILNSTFPGQTALQESILNAYPDLADSPYLLISAIITDSAFLCPTSARTKLFDLAGYDVWRYYYEGVFPNLSIFPDAGAYHSSEITQIFGTFPEAGATTTQKQLTQYMQKAWADFAKNPSKGPWWPKLGSNHGKELGALGADGGVGETTIEQSKVDAICAVYAAYIAANPL